MPRPAKLSKDQLAHLCAVIIRKHNAPSWQGIIDIIQEEFGVSIHLKSLQANPVVKEAYNKKREQVREKKVADKRKYHMRRSKAERSIEKHNAYNAAFAECMDNFFDQARLANIPLSKLPEKMELEPIKVEADG